MSRPVAKLTGRTRRGLSAAALGALGLLAMAAGSPAAGSPVSPGPAAGSGAAGGPVSSSTHSAAVAFTDLEYSVRFYGRVFNENSLDDNRMQPGPMKTSATWYFGEVAVDERAAGSLDLSFAVEGQPDASDYQLCEQPDRCHDITVQTTSQGLLHLYVAQALGPGAHWWLAGFPRQPVELSASDAGSGLKVYREVQVGPSPLAAGCDDYGEDTPEAYTCLFLRELLPAGSPAGVDEATLRAGLPELVQPGDNYSLLFAEEYDGTPPQADDAGCRDGLSTLDDDVWVRYDACGRADANGTPCATVADGTLFMAHAKNCRRPNGVASVGLGTYGKLHFKYGYIELKYEFNLHRPSFYSNFNVVLWPREQMLRFHTDQYGVVIDDWEDFTRNVETEIDIFELVPSRRMDYANQYLNWWFFQDHPNLAPMFSTKLIDYCGQNDRSIIVNPEPCQSDDTITITRGIEWTPRGYRNYIKVDGIHDELTLVPKDKITLRSQRLGPGGQLAGRTETLTGTERDRYFEYLDPTDNTTLLEQAAIAHMPLPIAMSVWEYSNLWGGIPTNDVIANWMKLDYIRVWQPTNLYTDMEPVFQ